ncbi:hypothetical protein [Salinimicrobium gaetbulicola]|uniref:Uncharacterized protein n=1 Tax=Salinimicrobium gaetbulicola TaxID=999702 RepID=A0ABW3ID84_9FLAO
MSEQQQNSDLESQNTETFNSQPEIPELYSKNLILVFAIVFSTLFAAVLLILNLRSLSKRNAGLQVLIFTILYLIATGIVIQSFNLQPGLTVIANVIGAAILNEYFWNKHIGSDLEYKKKGWMKPLMIALLIALSVFFLLMMSM